MWGISQPGFFAAAGMIDAHPALAAVSPQAPVTDYYLGDDDFHNGAFMLAANFGFYQDFRPRDGDPAAPQDIDPPTTAPPMATNSFSAWALWRRRRKYFQRRESLLHDDLEHTAYDSVGSPGQSGNT